MRKALMAACVATLVAVPVLASGGGGGGGGSFGGAPSADVPSYDPAAEYRDGVAALQAQKFKDALRSFRNVLSVTPHDANTNYLAGLSAAGLNDLKKAIAFFQKAIKYDPNLVAAHTQLGVALAKSGDAAGARIERDALAQKLAACGGDACANAAELKGAIAMIDAAATQGPHAQLDLAPPAQALAAKGGDREYLEAVALINAHRYADAVAALQKARWAFGAHPDVLTYLGFANRKMGHTAEAEGYYQTALAIAPDHRGALEYYGELKVERGDLAGARANLARLDSVCTFGCGQAEELRRWIAVRGAPRG